MAVRATTESTETVVQHTAEPLGRERENGPHLADLREFVAACEGLPGDLVVFITNGYLGESGRHDVTLRVRYRHPPATTPEREG